MDDLIGPEDPRFREFMGGDKWSDEQIELMLARKTAERFCPGLKTDAAKLELYREYLAMFEHGRKYGAPSFGD